MGRRTVIDMVGQRFNKLLVVAKYAATKKTTYWTCLCDCGVSKNISRTDLLRGIDNCGCETKNKMVKAHTTHNKTHHPLYTIWSSMKKRCYNPKDHKYKNYGGKGVTVCDEWRNDFMAFYNWALENGWQKRLNIDKDIKGGNTYSPENCSIVTAKKNHNHTICTIYMEHDGKICSLTDLCKIYGVDPQRTRNRYWRGIRNKEELFNPEKLKYVNSRQKCNP